MPLTFSNGTTASVNGTATWFAMGQTVTLRELPDTAEDLYQIVWVDQSGDLRLVGRLTELDLEWT